MTFDPSSLSDAESCPFCRIAATYPAYDPRNVSSKAESHSSPDASSTSSSSAHSLDPYLLSPPAFVVLSTDLCMAFLDILPLAPGHLLVTTRKHNTKLTDASSAESRELGFWLPVLSRVLANVSGVWDWNIVQNNGAAAAQVVPHVHFHIIPRPALTDELRNKSFTMFGRGQRSELDEDEAQELVKKLRDELAKEVERVQSRENL